MKTLFIFMVVVLSTGSSHAGDSTLVGSRRIQFDGTGSFLSLSNWKGSTLKSFSLATSADYFSIREKQNRQFVVAAQNQTAYTRFIDSVWVKSTDRFQLQLIYSHKVSTFSKTFSVLLHTGLLTGFEFIPDDTEGKLRKKMNNTFLLPADIEAGYGMGLKLNAVSYVNFTIATLRFRTEYGEPFDDDKPLFIMRNGFAAVDYGFGMQWYYFISLFPGTESLAEGKVFINGFNALRVQSDIHLKSTFKIWKQFHFKWELMCVYDPYVSGKMQWRNELLTGIVIVIHPQYSAAR